MNLSPKPAGLTVANSCGAGLSIPYRSIHKLTFSLKETLVIISGLLLVLKYVKMLTHKMLY
ncbi:hypothetical protein Lser_V15G10454 [Lactuca serriola]